MNQVRNIFLVSVLLFVTSTMAYGQVGKKQIVLATGDTTVLVNPISTGLQGRDARFLNKDKRYSNKQVFMDTDTKYNSLEEAALETNQLLKKVVKVSKDKDSNNSSLSFRVSQVNRMKNAKDKQAQSMVDSLLINSITPVEDVAELYARFGNKPTYYINNYEVASAVPDMLRPNEVLIRTVKVVGTMSGNPNGEIWYEVTPEAFTRIKSKMYIQSDN